MTRVKTNKTVIESWEQVRHYSNLMELNDTYTFILDALKSVQNHKYRNEYFKFELKHPIDKWELAQCKTLIHRDYLDIPLNLTHTRKYVYSMINYFYDKIDLNDVKVCIINILTNEFMDKKYSINELNIKCPTKFISQSKQHSVIYKEKLMSLIPSDIGERVYNKLENKRMFGF